jgi:DNA repair photolyase
MENSVHSGRGAVINPKNKFSVAQTLKIHQEGIDDFEESLPRTTFFNEYPKSIISRNSSPDIPFDLSINPYQGCEHGCVYCYARESHQYWGYSAGLDFESKIIVKHNAADLLERAFLNPKWKVEPIMLSGNTDPYQPAERRYRLTRKLLKTCLKFRNPVSIITKNALILRDLDILKELAERRLVNVMVSITSLNESLRRNLEPRTATSAKRLKVVRELSAAGIPVGVMIAPVIPGLNMNEIPAIAKAAADAGATDISHTMLRLNGPIEDIFRNWLSAVYPDRAQKVLSQVQSTHSGKTSDSRFMKRMLGEGRVAEMAAQMLKTSRQQFFKNPGFPEPDLKSFRRGGMYTIW